MLRARMYSLISGNAKLFNLFGADQATKGIEDLEKQGIKMRVYWNLGRYDGVAITEAPTEKDAMKAILSFQNLVTTETMVAVPREEAIKLL